MVFLHSSTKYTEHPTSFMGFSHHRWHLTLLSLFSAHYLIFDLFNPDCWDSDGSPPPLPARTPESFILATGAFALVTGVFSPGRCGFAGLPSELHPLLFSWLGKRTRVCSTIGTINSSCLLQLKIIIVLYPPFLSGILQCESRSPTD